MISYTRNNILLFTFLSYFIPAAVAVNAQDTIYLKNPSFEDVPRKGGEYYTPIKGWIDCGIVFPDESPPDIHPVPSGAWQVKMGPHDGKTYLGLVARYNDTYESVSQDLPGIIQGGKCYRLSVFMAKSPLYVSATLRTRANKELENFIKPLTLLVWGGNESCQKSELLIDSGPINNMEWEKYEFVISPKSTHRYITIEAYYETGYLVAYNGHILIDDLSPIIEISCKE